MSAARQQVRVVLQITLVLNFAVAVGKIAIGAITGALAISADGIHSLIDGLSNVLALLANRIAGKPADEQHPYGHRRFETIAAFGIGVMLLIAGWEIVTGALERLGSGYTPTLTPLAFAVMIGTLVVNLFISTYERRAGLRLRSELLIADAAHTRSDVYVTISVLASMALTAGGVGWADSAAALVVVGFIGKAAWEVLRGAGGVLVDQAPIPAADIAAAAAGIPGVEQVLRARSRGSADDAHIDVDVQVAPAMTADHSAAVAEAIRARLSAQIDGISEVEVHFAPRQEGDAARDAALIARAEADALGLSTHEVRVFDDADGRTLELHVEVPPGQTLVQAHEQVTQLERALAGGVPGVERVVTHIEPALAEVVAPSAEDADGAALIARALALLRGFDPDAVWHDAHLSALDGGCALTVHAALPPDLPLEQAHTRAEAAELLLRARLPNLRRVTIHTEPLE
jgi:cation diffusion facilitator family transporter